MRSQGGTLREVGRRKGGRDGNYMEWGVEELKRTMDAYFKTHNKQQGEKCHFSVSEDISSHIAE